MKNEESLPPDIARLIEAERAVELPRGAMQRVEERLVRELASDPAPVSGGALRRLRRAWAAAALWAVPTLAFGLGATIGTTALWQWGQWRRSHPATQPLGESSPAVPRVTPPVPAVAALPATPPPVQSEKPAPALAPPNRPAAAHAANRPAPSSGRDADAERALLDRARTALYRGAPTEALRALADCARRFPAGQLSEEREVLWIQAEAGSGNAGAAHERARAFRVRYPRSLFLPILSEVLHED